MYAQPHATIHITATHQHLLAAVANLLDNAEGLSVILDSAAPTAPEQSAAQEISSVLRGTGDGAVATLQPPSTYLTAVNVRSGFGVSQTTLRNWCDRLGLSLHQVTHGEPAYISREDYNPLRAWRFETEHPQLP